MQRVLVTAGGNGIGRAIALAFARDGARVHIADIDADAVRRVIDGDSRITGSVVDVGDRAAVKRLFDELPATLGGLDVLVNNAGVSGPTAPVADLDPAAWDAVIAVNLTGTFLVTRQAIPLLKQSPQASIIIMSSLAGRFGYPNRCAYATTKWGLVGFAKTLAMELGPFGVTCNTIHPGAVRGPRLMAVMEGRARATGRSLEEETDKALAIQSIARFIEPEDIAALTIFLAGRNARTISGQSFPIDGDSKSSQ
jgi:NAD(P)-dependent dehydrogenase (short-subunit alcohol dehydrogenase family)